MEEISGDEIPELGQVQQQQTQQEMNYNNVPGLEEVHPQDQNEEDLEENNNNNDEEEQGSNSTRSNEVDDEENQMEEQQEELTEQERIETILNMLKTSQLEEAKKIMRDFELSPNIRNEAGETPLYIAAALGDEPFVRELLAQDATVNLICNGYTPLHVAILNERFDIAKVLLKNGADINLCNILPIVIHSRDPKVFDIINFLLSNGAEPDAKTENGETALIAACKQNMKEVVKLLLQFKANPDFSFTPSGSSVLHIVSAQGNLELARLFLSRYPGYGHLANKFGETPLIVATKYGREDLVELFLREGLDHAGAAKVAPTPYFVALFIEADVKKRMAQTKLERQELRKQKREQQQQLLLKQQQQLQQQTQQLNGKEEEDVEAVSHSSPNDLDTTIITSNTTTPNKQTSKRPFRFISHERNSSTEVLDNNSRTLSVVSDTDMNESSTNETHNKQDKSTTRNDVDEEMREFEEENKLGDSDSSNEMQTMQLSNNLTNNNKNNNNTNNNNNKNSNSNKRQNKQQQRFSNHPENSIESNEVEFYSNEEDGTHDDSRQPPRQQHQHEISETRSGHDRKNSSKKKSNTNMNNSGNNNTKHNSNSSENDIQRVDSFTSNGTERSESGGDDDDPNRDRASYEFKYVHRNKDIPLFMNKRASLEDYLAEEEFQRIFKMSRMEFKNLPLWKRTILKQKVGLF